MTQNTTNNTPYKNRISAFFFGNRIIVSKGNEVAVNMPILAGIIAFLCSRWLTLAAVIIPMALGYRFSLKKKAAGDTKVFETMMQSAADNVKSAAAGLKQEIKDGIEAWDGVEDHH